MSRRLRIEEERARHVGDVDEEMKEDKFEIQKRRIYAPLVWTTTPTGFRIQDMKEKNFVEVIQMLKEHYMANELLCKNTELIEDELSVNCYLQRMYFQLKDSSSIIAVDENYVDKKVEVIKGEKKEDKELVEEEKEGESEEEEEQKEKPGANDDAPKPIKEKKIKIAGALVMNVLNKNDYGRVFSRVKLMEGEAMKKCTTFKSYINRKIKIFEKYKCDSFLRYCDLCVLPEYRGQALGYNMMACGMDVARTLGITYVMGLFQNDALQKLAGRLGMEVAYELNYVDWRNKEGELIFDDPGAGNYTCAIMVGYVSPTNLRSIPKQATNEDETEAVPKKMTRADKRIAASKKTKQQMPFNL